MREPVSSIDKLPGELKFLSLMDAVNGPESGFCMVVKNKWWAMCPERGLLFYKMKGDKGLGSPQYNGNQTTAERLVKSLWPGFELIQMPAVFIPVDIRDYL